MPSGPRTCPRPPAPRPTFSRSIEIMTRYVIVPIVEGHGEVGAVPVLLNRWLRHRNFHRYFEVHVAGPVRASGKGALKVEHHADEELGVEHYVEIALLRRPDAILVSLDADADDPRILGP